MHFQVPQYLDIEDKIIGPLTLKQFVYLLLGAGILFLLFNILKFGAFIIVAIPIALLTLMVAFYKIGNQKFIQFLASLFGFISKPNIYIWKKLPPKRPEKEPALKIIKKAEAPKKPPKESGLEELWWKIEIKQ
jgi:hypothetical protein